MPENVLSALIGTVPAILLGVLGFVRSLRADQLAHELSSMELVYKHNAELRAENARLWAELKEAKTPPAGA